MRQIILNFLLLFLSVTTVFGQLDGNLAWLLRDTDSPEPLMVGNSNGLFTNDRGLGVGKDSDGNIYTAGMYNNYSIYLYKLSPAGEILWEVSIQTDRTISNPLSMGPSQGNTLAVGHDGIYVAGSFRSTRNNATLIFSSTNSATPVTEVNQEPVFFVSKYGFDGRYIKTAYVRTNSNGGTVYANSSQLQDIAVDDQGDCYVVGMSDKTLRPETGSERLKRGRCTGGGSSSDALIFKLDMSQFDELVWAKALDAEGTAIFRGVAVDGSHVYAVGDYIGDLIGEYNLENNPGTCISDSRGNYPFTPDGIALKIDRSTGATVWRKSIESTTTTNSDQRIVDVAIDDNLGLFFSFEYESTANLRVNGSTVNLPTLDVNPGAVTAHTVAVGRVIDDSAPTVNFSWLQRLGVPVNYRDVRLHGGSGLVLDEIGNINVLFYSETIEDLAVGSSPMTTATVPVVQQIGFPVTGGSFTDAGIASFDASTGSFNNHIQFWGTSAEYLTGIVFSEEAYYLSGYSTGVTNYSPAPGSPYTEESSYYDGFLAKYDCPTIVLSAEKDTICLSESIEITAWTDSPEGSVNFQNTWTDVNNNVVLTNNLSTFSLNTNNLGTNQVHLEAVEAYSACVSRDTFNFVVNPSVTVSTSLSNAVICFGDSTTLGASASPSAGASYIWLNSSGDTVSMVQNASLFDDDIYTVEANVDGCKGQASVNLDYYPFTAARIIPDTAKICANTGALLTVIDCPGCSYVWDPPTTSLASSNNEQILADIAGVYDVEISDQYGCPTILQKDVQPGAYLTPPIYAEDINGVIRPSICNGRPVVIRSIPRASCSSCQYSWSDGTTGPFTFAMGTGTYSVTVTDVVSGCEGRSNDLVIESSSLAVPQIDADPYNICGTNPAILQVDNPCLGCTYSWYETDNNGTISSSVVGTGTVLSLPNVADTGSYIVQVTDTLACEEESAVADIGVGTTTPPVITGTGSKLCGTNTITLSTNSCVDCHYQWYLNAAVIPGATSSSYVANQAGVFSVELQYPNSCIHKSSDYTITFEAFNPKVDSTDLYLCNGAAVSLEIIGSYELPPNWSYQWYYNGVQIPGSNGYTHSASQAGTYFLEVVNASGCRAFSDSVVVRSSSAGANPVLNASPSIYSCGGDSVTLSVPPSPNCLYTFKLASGVNRQPDSINSYRTNVPNGYSVEVRDTISNCVYQSPVIEIKDTVLPVPAVTVASATNICSTSPVILSTPACAGCQYIWTYSGYNEQGDTVTWQETVSQSTYSADTTGSYEVQTLQSGCASPVSNSVPITRLSYNAQLNTAPLANVCNQDTVIIEAVPDTTLCPNCTYEWFQDNVQVPVPDTQDYFEVVQGGDYYVVVTQNYPGYSSSPYTFGCTDTSVVRNYSDVSLGVAMRASSEAICGPSGQVVLEVDSCVGCTYNWYYDGDTTNGFNYSNLGVNDTFYLVNGVAATGMYKVSVGLNGCFVEDSIYLYDTTALAIAIDTSTALYANICNGQPFELSSNCTSCDSIRNLSLHYQWYQDSMLIPGAIGASYQIDNAADYQLVVSDDLGCVNYSPITTAIEVLPPANFGLVLDSVAVVPISQGPILLDNYLQPVLVHNSGSYLSVPQATAVTTDSFIPALAGSGSHIISFEYQNQNCFFETFDTIDVLSPPSLDVANLNPLAPAEEACVQDSLVFYLSNITLEPNQILIATSATTYDTLAVSTAGLSEYAGVWSGNIPVVVPSSAVTGKVVLRDSVSGNEYVSDFFLVVQNPSVAISLNGVPQPLCSSADTIALSGFPQPGIFKAAYAATPSTYEPSLISGNNLLVENVQNYTPVSGTQQLEVTYVYQPTYSNNAAACPDSVVAVIPVSINNNEVDSIEFTPISVTETNVPMTDLTRLIWPLDSRFFPGFYVGTYINSGELLANTIPLAATANQTVDTAIYRFVNGSCRNETEQLIDVWQKPITLDSIPKFLCRNADTIFIGRNANSMYLEIDGMTYLLDSNYAYQPSLGVTDNVNYSYDEFINVMSLSSSNGGLQPISLTQGAERFAFIPALVSGTTTDLSISFRYERYHTYFTPTFSLNNVAYTIAELSKQVVIEDPIAAQINPAILADTIFCQDNSTQQFSGIPNGGQYYINYQPLVGNLFNPNQQAASQGVGSHLLTYVYQGNACVDSTSTSIYIPDTFSVSIFAPNGPTYCRLDPADTISVSSSVPGVLDTAAGMFLVGTTRSGQVFNPAFAPAVVGGNNVVYIAQDTFGCEARDSALFTVFAMPDIAITALDSVYCLNADTTILDLYEHNTSWHLQAPMAYNPGDVVQLTGNGVYNGGTNPTNPLYNPSAAGVGLDTITYDYTDVNGCNTVLTQYVEILPLPNLTLTTDNGVPLDSFYCEGDSVALFASPLGGDFFSLFSYEQGNPSNTIPSSFDTSVSPPLFTPFISGTAIPFGEEGLAYTYQDPITLCKDTIVDTIQINNFLTDATITGLPTQICADDTIYVLGVNPNGGPMPTPGLTTGYFGAFAAIDTNMIVDAVAGHFNPALSGIFDRGRSAIVTYTYLSNGCYNTVYDTAVLNPLPQLIYNMPGDSLFNRNDPTIHACFSQPAATLQAYNQYQGNINPIPQYIGTQPSLSQSGIFTTSSGLGMTWSVTFGNWAYEAQQANGGVDTIHYSFTDARGCSNTRSEVIVIDTVPELGFAGFDSKYLDTITGRYVYCENDPASLIIPSPFGGTSYLNYYEIPTGIFELIPDTLAYGDTTNIHRITYEFISARYHAGGVCLDSTIQMIEVRPTPDLQLVNAPNTFCVADSAQRVPLSATPYGGTFEDITLGAIAGIVGDSLFNPMAQLGSRQVIYYYTDTVSGCTDTIQHQIDVYNAPEVHFFSEGGCQGDSVQFNASPPGLSNSVPALDSITMVVWNYGDGLSDTLFSLVDPVNVPTQYHNYAQPGIYFPSLTVVNRGQCDTSFSRRIVVSPKYLVNDTMPYFQDFEADAGNWFQENEDSTINLPNDSLWAWGLADGFRITTIQYGNHVWATAPNGPYPEAEAGWVYSPCFDISTLGRPMVKLNIWRDSRQGTDGAVMQYFDDSTQTWRNLGIRNKGLNWYNPTYVVSDPGNQDGTPIGWSGTSNSWEDARYRLDVSGGDLRNRDNLRFRIAFAAANGSGGALYEGFAFDDVYIGNRSRSVLLEHFSNQNYAGIDDIERDLYSTVYSNLYGRDVQILQIHTNYGGYDYLNVFSADESSARVLYYGINDADQVRLNGSALANTTSSLVRYQQELMDMQMLQDAKFDIKMFPVNVQNGVLSTAFEIEALEDVMLLTDSLDVHVAITQDSIPSLQAHTMMSVLKAMRPDGAGEQIPSAWVMGDVLPYTRTWTFDPTQIDPTQLKVTVFVQNRQSKEVLQVNSSRNLNLFNGPVAIEELADEDGAEILDLNLYPNPAKEQFQVDFGAPLKGDYNWQLVDLLGRRLKDGQLQPGLQNLQIQTDGLTPGVYIFSVYNETVYSQRKVVIYR
ncbi:T9SS type A sorting domain-containing protein [Saprospira grandis]|uniref:Conserved repeat domain protein n=1 Tax=Saprospira grandis (strain Lewin) TaxID=984262 RepID=H6L9P4_SAPGL|nr:T9SS type A sorting domain-containing protein [Saprospira grandis]AFC23222.1 conserved repeat domain protein [Saprospira grandis str. Lewin]